MPILLALLGSRIAQLTLAAIFGFGWGWWNTSTRWRDYAAKERAAREMMHQMELARQAKAAAEIALADRTRADSATKAADAMQAEIDDLKSKLGQKGSGNATAGGCVIDGDYLRRVQRLDRSGRH